jgi:DNA-directed RNA polymerase subunit M
MSFNKGCFVCKRCGYKLQPKEKELIKTERVKKRYGIIEEKFDLSPKTRVRCPKCGNLEAYWEIRQVRAADEPETKFYRCCKCNYSWREE